MKTLEDYQTYFTTDLTQLLKTSQNNLMWLSQSHFGDFLIEKTPNKNNSYWELWRNHDDSINQGEAIIEIYYFGESTNYTREKIFKTK
jgi:hypothetical protein